MAVHAALDALEALATRLPRLEREQGAAGVERGRAWRRLPRNHNGFPRYSLRDDDKTSWPGVVYWNGSGWQAVAGDKPGDSGDRLDLAMADAEQLTGHVGAIRPPEAMPAPTPPADKAGPAPGYEVREVPAWQRFPNQPPIFDVLLRGAIVVAKRTYEEGVAATWEHAKAAAAEATHAHAAQQPATSGRGEATGRTCASCPNTAACLAKAACDVARMVQGTVSRSSPCGCSVDVAEGGELIHAMHMGTLQRPWVVKHCAEHSGAATPPRTRSALTVAADAVNIHRGFLNAAMHHSIGDDYAAARLAGDHLTEIENELRREAAKGGE